MCILTILPLNQLTSTVEGKNNGKNKQPTNQPTNQKQEKSKQT